MLFITVGAQLYCGMSSITSASRMLYAFSRDRATPGHQWWRRLNAARVPYMAVMAIETFGFRTTLAVDAFGTCPEFR